MERWYNPGNRAENTAAYFVNRTSAGSYRLVGDTDSIIQTVKFENAAYHAGNSNDWTIGIFIACKAEDWPRMNNEEKTDLCSQQHKWLK